MNISDTVNNYKRNMIVVVYRPIACLSVQIFTETSKIITIINLLLK